MTVKKNQHHRLHKSCITINVLMYYNYLINNFTALRLTFKMVKPSDA